MSKRKPTNHFSRMLALKYPEANVKEWIQKELGLSYNLFIHHFNKGTLKREVVYRAMGKLDMDYWELFPNTEEGQQEDNRTEEQKQIAKSKIVSGSLHEKFKNAKDGKEDVLNQEHIDQRPKDVAKPKAEKTQLEEIEDDKLEFL